MQQTAFLNKKGVTLVEVMISLVILLFVFMGLIQASLLSINSNLRNEIRDEAVRAAAGQMTIARSTYNDPVNGVTVGAAVCPTPIPAALPAPAQPYAFSVPDPTLPVPGSLTRVLRNLTQPYTVWRSSCFTDATQTSVWVSIVVDYRYPDETVANNRQATTSVIKRP